MKHVRKCQCYCAAKIKKKNHEVRMGATSDACLKHGGQTLYTVHKNHTHHLQKKKICVVSEFGHLEKPTENKFGNEAEHNLTGIYLMLY